MAPALDDVYPAGATAGTLRMEMPAAPSHNDAAGRRANSSTLVLAAEPTETALVPPRIHSTPEPSLTPEPFELETGLLGKASFEESERR